MPDKALLEVNPDIEQMPIPKIPDEREIVSRVKINAKSLRLLCRDFPAFLQRAKETPTAEAVKLYFTRMYHLLLRLSNDLAGHEYGAVRFREPVSWQEMNETLLVDLRESFRLIEEATPSVKKSGLDSEIKLLIDEIEDIKQEIKKTLFGHKSKKPIADIEVRI